MEDQGKRLLLAVAIAFALLWGWSILFPPKAPEKPAESADASSSSSTAVERNKGGDGTDNGVSPATTGTSADSDAEKERGPEQVETFTFDRFEAEFSNYGGSLRSWKLLGKQFEDRTVSPVVPLNLLAASQLGHDHYSLQVSLGKGAPLAAMEHAEWTLLERSETSIKYQWASAELEVTKTFEIDPSDYFLSLTLDIVKRGGESAQHELTVILHGYQDPAGVVEGGMTQLPREWKSACLVDDKIASASLKDLAKKPLERDELGVRWGGFYHSYFVVASAPKRDDSRIECAAQLVAGIEGLMRLELKFPRVVLDAGDARYRRRIASYLGPKFMSSLEQATELSGFDANFEDAVDLGWLSFISAPLLWLLTVFQGFVVNWGVAIILLTLVVKLVVLPWTHKSIKSMKGMSKLKPQMEKIREKYADDKQRQQVETMNLFKTHGVNPLAGCLPMVLQMPIWFALYRMLMNAAELYQTQFIPGWMDDLTAPDPFFIMPVLVTGMMFLQTRLTPTTATGMQAKILMYGMPIMFGFFSLFFPAGLTLYIFTNTCLTLIHYYFVHKEDREKARVAKKSGKSVVDALAGINDDDTDDDTNDIHPDAHPGKKSGDESSGSASRGSTSRGSTSRGSTSRGSTSRGKGSRGGKSKKKNKKKKKKSNAI